MWQEKQVLPEWEREQQEAPQQEPVLQARLRELRVQEVLLTEKQQKGQRQLAPLLEAPSPEEQPRSAQMWNHPEPSWQPQQPELSELLNVHKPGVPTQENRPPTQTIGVLTVAPLLVGFQKVQAQMVAAQKTDRVGPLDPLEDQLGFQEERIRD